MEQDVAFPRWQLGRQPQHLLLTLLGDYWQGSDVLIPSAALVHLLAEFGVTSAGSRAALSRLGRRGLLVSSRAGRYTFYGLSQRAREILDDGADRIARFGAEEKTWDGTWTFVAFSIPESQRDLRHALRVRLRWLGFAPLYDGLWISPHSQPGDACRALDDLRVEAATVITGRADDRPLGAGSPIGAWDLGQLRAAYQEFIDRFSPLAARVRAGDVGAAEALVARTRIMDDWRNMPNLDPELPTELLPPGWPRRTARHLFVEIYDGLGQLAEVRIRQVLAQLAPELAGAASHHRTGLAAAAPA
jgi:phenylacetic acid degradation operon negative regulatory protein